MQHVIGTICPRGCFWNDLSQTLFLERFVQEVISFCTRGGFWNDLDMLEIGNSSSSQQIDAPDMRVNPIAKKVYQSPYSQRHGPGGKQKY